jgi:hypothetical protein
METVERTTDYELFKTLDGNRPVNEGHVRRLMESFKRKYLKTPIFVNSKNYVVDGQHRLEAAKRLGLPVYYLKVNGYELTEVQMLNTNNKTWMKSDYLNSYCNLGSKPYLQLREFSDNYPDFNLGTAEVIFTNSLSGADKNNFVSIGKGHSVRRIRPFEEGLLETKDLGKAYENAGKLMQYKPLFDGFNTKTFVKIMISLFKKKNFDHETMIRKLEIQPGALKKCATADQYISLIEELYNYKSRNKVNLRY